MTTTKEVSTAGRAQATPPLQAMRRKQQRPPSPSPVLLAPTTVPLAPLISLALLWVTHWPRSVAMRMAYRVRMATSV